MGIEPTFNKDGYPTEETMKAIETWPHTDFNGLLQFVKKAWKYPEYFSNKNGYYRISTGGWSGNESIISAMMKNHIFWGCCWVLSQRGGHYEFEIERDKT